MKRPLKSKRPFGPIVNLNEKDTEVSQSSETSVVEEQDQSNNKDVHFNSIEDLPDSPMLKQYIEREVEYTGLDEQTVINSTPVKEYMIKLGVWEKAVSMNT